MNTLKCWEGNTDTPYVCIHLAQTTENQSLVWEDPLQKGTATHSSILAWRIPQTEEPGGPSPWGLQRNQT